MLKDEPLGVVLNVGYPGAWRQNVYVAVQELQLEEGADGGEGILRHLIEPVRHSVVHVPDVGIRVLPRLAAGLKQVHVPFGLDLADPEQIEGRVKRLKEDVGLRRIFRRCGRVVEGERDMSGFVREGEGSGLDERGGSERAQLGQKE